MMARRFIEVTAREDQGAPKDVMVNIDCIAHYSAHEDGSRIRLMTGYSISVEEPPTVIDERIAQACTGVQSTIKQIFDAVRECGGDPEQLTSAQIERFVSLALHDLLHPHAC